MNREVSIKMAKSESMFLEKMARLIPGIAGYLKIERARETDQRLRHLLSDRLAEVKHQVESLERTLSENRVLMGLDRLERICKKIDQAKDTIKYSSRGYSGLFDGIRIRDAEVEKLYAFDLSLAGEIEILESRVQSYEINSGQIIPWSDALERAVDQFMDTIHKRKSLLETAEIGGQ